MFLIFGDKDRTEPVPDGLRVHRTCPKCGEHTLFVERVVSHQFRLYFVDMFTHGSHHVLECSSCKTAFVTDEVKGKSVVNDQTGTLVGRARAALDRGKRALASDEVAGALRRAEEEVGKTVSTARLGLSALAGRFKRTSDRD